MGSKWIWLVAVAVAATGCAPVKVIKCTKEFSYDQNGRLASEYSECIEQVPNSIPPVTLRHKELLQ